MSGFPGRILGADMGVAEDREIFLMDHLELCHLCGKGHLTKVVVCHFLPGSRTPPSLLPLKRKFPQDKAIADPPQER